MSTGLKAGRYERGRVGAVSWGALSGVLASGLIILVGAPATAQEQTAPPTPQPSSAQAQIYEPAYFARFAPKSAADMVNNIPGFTISGGDEDERGFGQAKQNVLINGRRVSGKSNDAATALGRITADSVVRIEIVDGATLNIPGLSGQVANVVAKLDALSGNWNWNPEFRENLQPSWFRGAVSANGSTENGWSWSASLSSFEFHNGHDGPGVITNGAGAVTDMTDVRREGFNGAGEEPELNATLTYETVAGSIANLNLSLEWFNFVGREDSFRNPVRGPENRFVFIGEDDRGGEIGADWEFDLGPGRLKLIGLHSAWEEWDLFTVETYRAGAEPEGDRSDFYGESGESILRSEYSFGLFGGDMQWAAEGAFNFLDVATNIGGRRADGSYVLAPLAGGNARVEEKRAETNLSYRRTLSDAWSLQSSLGVEFSELSQVGAGGLTREFVRPKGFLALVWKPDDKLDVSLKGERKVGQLDFGDFLSSVDLQNNNQSSGNVDLVPEQSWILSSEVNRKLGDWGAVKLAGEYHFIEDVVDRVPIDANGLPVIDPAANAASIVGQGVGNIDSATASSITGSGTINFDPIGIKGLQLEFSYRYRDSEVEDPLTGESRQISNYPKVTTVSSFRWDIPETSWTLVAGIEEFQNYATYRLDQISRNWVAPSVNFFSIENKDVFGMKVRLQAVNLNDSSENFKREVYCNQTCVFVDPGEPGYDPSPRLRTNQLHFVEERHRTFGPIIRLNVSGTF
jgi:outer membrane receptor for ferrienterochelin and colicins